MIGAIDCEGVEGGRLDVDEFERDRKEEEFEDDDIEETSETTESISV